MISDEKLVKLLKEKVQFEKKLTSEIISYLEEVNNRRIYVEYYCSSLFKFCTNVLKYSDSEATLRIKAIRVPKKLPKLKKNLKKAKSL